MDLDALAQLHANRCNNAVGYATSTHSGVAAVLEAIADEGRALVARSTDVYDNRLVLQLVAQLDRLSRPVISKRPTRAVN